MALGLGSAATADVGGDQGDVAALNAFGQFEDAQDRCRRHHAEIQRSTALVDTRITNAVIGNTPSKGIDVTYDVNGKLNFIVTGNVVHTDSEFNGDGTTGQSIRIGEQRNHRTASGSGQHALLMDTLSSGMLPTTGCGGRKMQPRPQVQALQASPIPARFTGLGTTASLLDLADNAVDTDQLAVDAVTVSQIGC